MVPNALAEDFTANQLDDLAYLFWNAARSNRGLNQVADMLWEARDIAIEKENSDATA